LSRIPRSSLFYFFLIIVLGFVFWFTWQQFEGGPKGGQWSYSQLINSAQAGGVRSVDIKGATATATAKDGSQHDVNLPDTTEALATELVKDSVTVNYQQASSSQYWLSVLLPNLILLLLIGGFMYYILRQTQSGNNQAMSFGRSRARLIAGDKPQVTFADVAGVDEAKQELTEVVEFLKYPEKFVALGARIPKGVLMVGPPGTG
jgi:cell division protease FtsH